MTKGNLEQLLREAVEGLRELYGPRLKGVLLYGSYARGEAEEDSDVDLLIVLDRIGRYATEVDRTGELISCIALKYGGSISRVFVEERDWAERRTPFPERVRAEARSRRKPESCWRKPSVPSRRPKRSFGEETWSLRQAAPTTLCSMRPPPSCMRRG